MNAEPEMAAPEPAAGATGLFTGSGGWRAIARLVIYFAIGFTGLILLGVVIATALRHVPGFLGTPLALILDKSILVACSFGAAAVMAKLEKRPFGIYGLPWRTDFGKYFWQGAAWGLAEVTALMLLIAAAHGYSFGSVVLRGGQVLRYGFLWAAVFLLVGFSEEFLFRGYTQFTLTTAFGFWPAAVALSLGFAAAHYSNPGEGWPGLAQVFIIGMFFCLTLRRTGSLWFAVGMHAAFDFGETFLFSVPNSGFVAEGHLSNASLRGPAWLTGGAVGPEGSVFSFVTLAILFVLFARFYPANPKHSDGAD